MLCCVCGIRETMPSRGKVGPKPKYCEPCHREVQLEHNRRHAARLRQTPEWREYMRQYFRTHKYPPTPPKPGRPRWTHISHRYGLQPEHVQAWFDFQEGKCALCGEPLKPRFHIDHDHTTGIIRGLLHSRCNQFLDTYPERLPNVNAYLTGWVA